MDFGENQPYIVNMLLKRKMIRPEQVESAKAEAEKKSMGIVDALVEKKVLSEEKIMGALAADQGMEFLLLFKQNIDPNALDKITFEQAKEFHIMPVRLDYDTLVIATHRPLDLNYIDNIRHVLGIPIETVIATYSAIEEGIQQFYQTSSHMQSSLQGAEELDEKEMENIFSKAMEKGDAPKTEEDAPVIRLVSTMIAEAARMRASDIHLEAMEKYFRIRYRIDGVLVEMKRHPRQLQASIISRIKLLADMQIAEKRLPQDGKIKIKIKSRLLDIRVSTLPSTHGESVVMRLLDKKELNLGIANLGFLSDTEKIWNELITLPNGVILITGPTGSGKTTTLYSCLNVLNKSSRKIITVEDPIEYQLTGINQVQVKEEVDLTFSNVLRACLRQAPNIIMIGEIRDSETARIAMNAAFTGHLVFSTLHTNDAPGAITRLIDQGIEPFLVASAVRAVLAQRLVRRICQNCKATYPASEYEMKLLNLKSGQHMIAKGQGCPSCNHTGYKGRFGIFEMMLMGPEIQDLVYGRKTASDIRTAAIKLGMRTLREDAIIKVLNGSTSIDELLRVTKIGET